MALSHADLCCDYQVRIKLFWQVFLFHDKELIALWIEVFFYDPITHSNLHCRMTLWLHTHRKMQMNSCDALASPILQLNHMLLRSRNTLKLIDPPARLSALRCVVSTSDSIRDLKEHLLNMTVESNTIHYSRQCWLWRRLDRQWSDQRCFDMSNFDLHSWVLP